jgi:TRAP-type C4-dicarboxylate transport system permease small subunit
MMMAAPAAPILHRISRTLAWVSGGLVLLCAALVALDVLTRTLLQRVLFESFELSAYGFAISVSLGLGYTATERANVRVDTINAILPRAARIALDVLAIVALAGFAAVLAWQTAQVAIASFGMSARSNSSLAVPLVYPQGLWALGICWFALVAILLAAGTLRAAAARRWTEIERLAGLRATQAATAERESI